MINKLNLMSDQESRALILAELQDNQNRLDECKRHYWPSMEYTIGAVCVCANCGGCMKVVEAAEYLNGYRAAGGNPNDVLPGYNK